MTRSASKALLLTGLSVWSAVVNAQAPADASVQDEQITAENPASQPGITVFGRAIEQIGVAKTGSQGTVGYADLENVPISRIGELVENVPGVIATQHSGTGKANQYFLRGFNLDHGTDFAGFVDGVPINMRTHGHGQGYLDFNFLIPEAIERIDFRKGPYFADVGDFSAAGTVAFKTKDTLAPFAKIEAGEFGFLRAVSGGSGSIGSGSLMAIAEAQLYDGPWDFPEQLERFAGIVKYSSGGEKNRFSLQLNAYDARWVSTDQIPERAVQSGLIGRFGNIDDDLGGDTTRLGAVVNGVVGDTRFDAFVTYYDFRLTSNFTYFLDDPVNGDEFVQLDERVVFGGALAHRFAWDGIVLTLGGDLRVDNISDVGLFDSVDGKVVATTRRDAVDQTGLGLYLDTTVTIAPNLRAFGGLRYDRISYDVRSDLEANSGSGSDDLLAPKAGLAWQTSPALELYASYGHSFHSNDVRGATITVDPASGMAAERVPVLARAEGAELGARIETGTLKAALVGFWLELESELVFVGDGGATEPNDGSRRFGVEANMFWQPLPWLALDAAITATNARFVGPEAGMKEIPGAVPLVLSGGVIARPTETISLSAQLAISVARR